MIRVEYTIKQVAEEVGLSAPTIRRRIKDGEIRAEKKSGPYGEQWFIAEEEVKELKAQQAQEIREVVPVEEHLDKNELLEVLVRAIKERDQDLNERITGLEERIDKQNRLLEEQKKKIEERDQHLMEYIREKQNQDSEAVGIWERFKGFFTR